MIDRRALDTCLFEQDTLLNGKLLTDIIDIYSKIIKAYENISLKYLSIPLSLSIYIS